MPQLGYKRGVFVYFLFTKPAEKHWQIEHTVRELKQRLTYCIRKLYFRDFGETFLFLTLYGIDWKRNTQKVNKCKILVLEY